MQQSDRKGLTKKGERKGLIKNSYDGDDDEDEDDDDHEDEDEGTEEEEE